jgi:hypothetical protein
MSKNLTRKGIALGAVVALGSSLFAGSPAFATDTVTLAPKTGTSYSLISGETFTLTAATGSLVPSSSWNTLKTRVTNNSSLSYTTTASQAGATFIGNISAATTASTVIEYTSGTVTSGIKDITIAVAAADAGTFTVQSWLDANGNDLIDDAFVSPSRTVTFVKAANVTATTTVTAPLAGDTAVSATVAFNGINNEQVAAANVGALFTKGDNTALATTAAAITAVTQGTGTAIVYTANNTFVVGQRVSVTLLAPAGYNVTNAVVTAATATSFTVASAENGAVTDAVGSAAVASAVVTNRAWSTTDSFKFGLGNLAALASTDALKVTALWKAGGNPTSTDTVGTAVTSPIAVRSITTFTSDGIVSTTQAANETVALNKAFSVFARGVDNSSPAKGVSGKTVSYSVTQANLPATAASVTSSTATLTINGVTYTNQAALPGATGVARLTGVTNADGRVTVTGSSTGLANGQTIVFAFSVENFTSSLTLTQNTITPTTAYITNYEGDAAAVASGASVSVNIAAYDQFGGAMADGYDARAVWASSTRTTTATTNTTPAVVAAVVGGKATLTLPDAGAGTGTNVWNLSITQRNAATNAYTGFTSALGSLEFATPDAVTAFTVNFRAAADLVAGTIALTDGSAALALNTEKTKYIYTVGQEGAIATPGDLTLDGFGTFDARGVVGTVPAPLKTIAGSVAAVAVDLAGTVSSTSTSTYAGVAIPGTTVTISGAGLQFQGVQGGQNVWTTGSITLNTNASGAFSVNIWSTKAGVQTVTVKSGSATSVVDLYFDAAAETSGTAIAITAPKNIKSGKTLVVSAVVTDKFGNPVDTNQGASDARTTGALTFSVTYDGPGFVIGDLPTKTDANGKISFRVLLGSGDTGLGTVTVAYDIDGAATTNAAVTATSNILYGVSAAATPGSKRANVTVKNAEGLTVKVVSGSTTVTRVATSDSQRVSITKLRAGKRTVKVYVNDILVRSQVVTVRR